MIEFNLDGSSAGNAPDNIAVSVVGIGGSGSNVLDRIALEGMPAAELICIASDIRVLNNSMAARKIQLGAKLTQGLGAGGDPEMGLEAAQASEVEIRDLFQNKSMVFICMGLGGGTGSGAAPYIARLARESGAFVVIFATLPFSFEGRRRQKQANVALEDLRQQANALITFENDRMGELVVPKKGIQEAFQLADRVIGQSVRAVTSLVTQPGLIRIGMADLITALKNTDSRCLFGYGQAKGENRAMDALNTALKSPLLDRGQMLAKAQNVLVHVVGGTNMSLFEIQTLMGELNKHVGDDAHLLFGAAVDAKLGDHISVTVLTSLGKPAGASALPTTRPQIETAPPVVEKPAAVAAPVPQVVIPEPKNFVVVPDPVPAPVERPRPAAIAPVPAPEKEEEAEDEIVEELKVVPRQAPRLLRAEPARPQEEAPAPPVARRAPAPAPIIDEEEYDDEEEEDEDEPIAPPPARKFAIRDVLNKPNGEAPVRPRPAATPLPAQPAIPPQRGASTPFQPVRQAPAAQRTVAVSGEQQNFDERLQGANRGKFEKIDPTLEDGLDLDVPTFLRKKR